MSVTHSTRTRRDDMQFTGVYPGQPDHAAASLVLQYRRRLIRKRLLWRAFRKRRELRILYDNRSKIRDTSILLFSTIRNEEMRLPHFFDHYRGLGVDHFIFVDNASDDGSVDILSKQPDVTVFQTHASYRASRFGVDWLNWLKFKHAAGHWVIVSDADELLVYPDYESKNLATLTAWLRANRRDAMGAIMLDLYPKGSPDEQTYTPDQDPVDVLQWFDADGYWAQRQKKLGNLWLQGGPRARKFFVQNPDRAPTLNKIPLVYWRKGYAFVNSTHSALPSRLNETWSTPISGALLHTKFLPGVAQRAAQERARDEHFQVGTLYSEYYQSLAHSPDLWIEASQKYTGWQQLVDLKLMSRPNW